MRIVYVLTTLAIGGAERQVLAIAGRMAARGHTVALLVLKPQAPEDCEKALDTLHLDIDKSARSTIAGMRRGVAFLRAFRPDVIHSHNFHGNMLARLMRLFCRQAKLIATIHNVYEGGRARMLAYRLSRRLADQTTAVSAAVAERFIRLRAVEPERCVIVTNGTETEAFVPDAKRRVATRAEIGADDEFIWLTVGRITAAKDLPNLLRAFAEVHGKQPHTQLWIAGGAERESAVPLNYFAGMPPSARDRMRQLGLRHDVPALLDAADGLVLASAWEGMPMAVGEAMAMGKPVVATDVGGVRELVGDAGVLVPAKDSQALAAAMLGVMEQTAPARADIGQAARQRILDYFDMEAKADAWEAMYRSLLACDCVEAGGGTLLPEQKEDHSRG